MTYRSVVPKGGLEPPRVAPHAPQTCASANSATSAPAKAQYAAPPRALSIRLAAECCWSIEMSPRNCSVRVSPHGDMGDAHDEPQGSAAGRPAQGRARPEDQQCPRRPGPAPERAAVPTLEAPLRGRK